MKFTVDDRYDRIIGTNFKMFASSSSSLKASDASLWLFVFSVIEPRDAISQASIKKFYIFVLRLSLCFVFMNFYEFWTQTQMVAAESKLGKG